MARPGHAAFRKETEPHVHDAGICAGRRSAATACWSSLLPFVLIFVIMYFLILRPQQKRVKEHAEMVKNVRRGDTVITSGGLVGKVTKVIDDEQIEVEMADGCGSARCGR